MSTHPSVLARFTWSGTFWSFVHTITLHPLIFYNDVSSIVDTLERLEVFIPCSACKQHFKEFKEQNRAMTYFEDDNHLGLFRWTVELHNSINDKLGKRIMTFQEAIDTWANICV
jgi:hypothetical protein